MVEVLIAGILIASALTAVSRISVAALTGSTNLADRARIEAAINDNIQSMQKEDSYFTDAFVIENKGRDWFRDNACEKPAEELGNHLKAVTKANNHKGVTIKDVDMLTPANNEMKKGLIERLFDAKSNPKVLRIVYHFEGPEQQVKREKRLIEMTPNFAAKCYRTR